MAWILAPMVTTFRANLNTAFPERLKHSDGTIGDPAHAASVSGHNPDDTYGVSAEASDADSVPEVRAFDADKDLDGANTPRSRMQSVLNSILATPRDRDRFLYFIFDGYIWSKRYGWRKRVYEGANKHREHLHASGDPKYDNDTAPFQSVLKFKPVPPAPPPPPPPPQVHTLPAAILSNLQGSSQ